MQKKYLGDFFVVVVVFKKDDMFNVSCVIDHRFKPLSTIFYVLNRLRRLYYPQPLRDSVSPVSRVFELAKQFYWVF